MAQVTLEQIPTINLLLLSQAQSLSTALRSIYLALSIDFPDDSINQLLLDCSRRLDFVDTQTVYDIIFDRNRTLALGIKGSMIRELLGNAAFKYVRFHFPIHIKPAF